MKTVENINNLKRHKTVNYASATAAVAMSKHSVD